MGYWSDFAEVWGYLTEATKAIVNPTSTIVEYLTKPTIDQTVEAFYETSIVVSNVTSTVLNGSISPDLFRNTPGVSEAGVISGVVTPLISFGVTMGHTLISIIDVSLFFLVDPIFTLLLFEWFIIILVVEQKMSGKVGGGEMIVNIFTYQFKAAKVIFDISIRLLELAISFGSFIRSLIPII